jgi:hypothetical protein
LRAVHECKKQNGFGKMTQCITYRPSFLKVWVWNEYYCTQLGGL